MFMEGDRVQYCLDQFPEHHDSKGTVTSYYVKGMVLPVEYSIPEDMRIREGYEYLVQVRWDEGCSLGRQKHKKDLYWNICLKKINEYLPYDPNQQGDTDEDI